MSYQTCDLLDGVKSWHFWSILAVDTLAQTYRNFKLKVSFYTSNTLSKRPSKLTVTSLIKPSEKYPYFE